ncbi:MAG: type III secretion system translocon subunit SctE [Deltaproteobacteria bacterium]|jgi:hypothetical protein|nr:type III secretion system translocon subunit SctE [Deltaproteobacteria bacterium]
MATIEPTQTTTPTTTTDPINETGLQGTQTTSSTEEVLPPAFTVDNLIAFLQERPELAAPLLASGLSLEVLVEALGSKERETTVKVSSETLKAKAEQRKEANDKKLQEIGDNLEKMREQEKLSVFQKIFKYIGMAVGALASIATIALGAVTGNPLLVAAGVMMAIMVVDSIVSEASDGKYSISAGVAEIAKACGADEETAKWIGFGVNMALMAITMVLSFGAAAGGGVAAAASQITSILSKVQTVTNIVNGVNMIGQGSVAICSAIVDHDIAQNQADMKELEALLQKILTAMETEEAFLKFILEKFEKLVSGVSEIIEQSNQAQETLLSGKTPALA